MRSLEAELSFYAQILGFTPGDPIEPVPGYVFRSEEEAEWVVFKLRWRELTGRELAIE